MAGAIPLRGAKGAIRWHYFMAAGVVDFTVVYDPASRAWTMRGGLVAPNAFKLTQAPLEFFVPTKTGAMRWPVQAFQMRENRITATLGPLLQEQTQPYEPIRSA